MKFDLYNLRLTQLRHCVSCYFCYDAGDEIKISGHEQTTEERRQGFISRDITLPCENINIATYT